MTAGVRALAAETFSSLKIPNYKRYFLAQVASQSGTWMQTTAQAWLVLTLTNSAAALGLILALQTLPVLLFAPYGGLIADRMDKRKLMVVLNSSMGCQALALGALTMAGDIRFWGVCVLASILGLHQAFETPARQSFIREIVGTAHLRNAVTLNSVNQNVARAVGPAIGGLLINYVGIGECFVINAASYIAIVVALCRLDRATLRPAEPAARAKGQLREGIAYARKTPQIAIPVIVMTIIGLFAFNFQVTLPVFVHKTFHSGSAQYGFLNSCQGGGAILGGLYAATRGRTGIRKMVISVTMFGVALVLLGLAPTLLAAYALMIVVGWCSITFTTTGNTTIQLAASPQMRGRAIALWQVAFQGSTPIGAPIVGGIIEATNARVGVEVGGISCLVAAVGGYLLARQARALEPKTLEAGTPIDTGGADAAA